MIRKEVIFIVRAINYMATNRRYGTSDALTNLPNDHRVKKIKKIDRILKNLKESEKKSIMRIIKSGALLTAGSVSSVRNPESFDIDAAAGWMNYINNYVIDILIAYDITTFEELEKEVTKQDYRDAKRILPIMGASSITDKDADIISKKYDMDKEEVVDTRKGGLGKKVQILYRGLRDMSAKSLVWLTKKKSTWNLTRGVSTSFDETTSRNFAAKRGGYRILITIQNPNRIGFQFDDLSKYKNEDEIIFSGNLLVKDDWKLTYRSPPNKRKKYQAIAKDGDVEIWTEDVLITSSGADIKVSINGRYSEKISVSLKGDGHKMVEDLLDNNLAIEVKHHRIPGGVARVKIGTLKTNTWLYVNTIVESKNEN